MAVVHRGFAVVAWLVATVLSVGISTAAVGNVRAQVSERSSLMSLAAIRSATSTTTTTVVLAASRQADIPSLAVVLDPTTSEPPPLSTTITSTTTVPAPLTEPSPGPATTPPAPETTARQDGSEPVEQVAVDGGVVKVGLANDSLQLIDALPEEGYQVRMGEWLDAVIEVQFVGSDHLWNVVAELEDGRIVISERRVDREHRDGDEPDDGHRGEDDHRWTGPGHGVSDDEPDGESDEGRKGRPGGRGGEDHGHRGGSGDGGWDGRGDGSGDRDGGVYPGDEHPGAESTTSVPD